MHYDLGYIDLEQKTLQPIDNPFGPGLSPMSLVQSVTHVSGLYIWKTGAGEGNRTLVCSLGSYVKLLNLLTRVPVVDPRNRRKAPVWIFDPGI